MAGSNYGKVFTVSTWGESHGSGLGVVVDGCPAGLDLCEEDIQCDLDKRKPGQSPFSTPRKEKDRIEILSGVFNGKTTGTPISLMVWNKDQRSKDYSKIADCYRPGHADLTYDLKYGFRDYRGGGRSSGRETIGRVAAGAIAKRILSTMGVDILTYTKSIGTVTIDNKNFDRNAIHKNYLCMPDKEAVSEAEKYLNDLIQQHNSAGGIIECQINHLPSGVGEPVFDKLDARLAYAIMSIGSVKGIEFGTGFNAASSTGLDNNDSYYYDEEHHIQKKSNHAGGMLGGISDGTEIILRAAIKPTPSIRSEQASVNKQGEDIDLVIEGRHDPIIVPRAVIVVEAMVAITLVDMLFINMCSTMDTIKKIYH